MVDTVVDKTELAQQVSDQINQLKAEMVQASAADVLQLLQRTELSLSRALALIFLDRQKSASISDISGYLNLSLGNTSHLIEQLVCGGYVTRVEDLHDRRLRQVMLTTNGQAFVAEVKAVHIRDLAARLHGLPEPLLQRATEVLSAMLVQLRTSEGAVKQ
ncbi:MAG: winged helix DNA-binding protein [Caldilineaceae bacterium]|nr:winged helix DNA-binding protein [Caldilineaceae bacterium]